VKPYRDVRALLDSRIYIEDWKLGSLRCGGKDETTQDYIVHLGFVWELGCCARHEPRQHRAGWDEHDANITNNTIAIGSIWCDDAIAVDDAILTGNAVA
jgi:hypothetical protein